MSNPLETIDTKTNWLARARQVEVLMLTILTISLRIWPTILVLFAAWVILVYTEQGNDILQRARADRLQGWRFMACLHILTFSAAFCAVYLLRLPPDWDVHHIIARAAKFIRSEDRGIGYHTGLRALALVLPLGAVMLFLPSLAPYIFANVSWPEQVLYGFYLWAITFVATLFILFKLITLPRQKILAISRNAAVLSLVGITIFGVFPVHLGSWLGADFALFMVLSLWLLLICGLIAQFRAHRIQLLSVVGIYLTLWLVSASYGIMVGAAAPAPALRCVEGDCKPRDPTAPLDVLWREWRSQFAAEERPVLLLVAAAGGGARASYWSSVVLGRLTDRAPDAVRRHLFLASGVSGGALAITLHNAILVEHGLLCGGAISVEACARRFGEGDFLGPNIIAFLTRDAWKSILPVDFIPGRDIALEQAWERRWRQLGGSNTFGKPFLSLWTTRELPFPALILNATSTRTGERLIVSNLRAQGLLSVAVGCATNLAEHINLPVSAAVNASARFPIVDPPGAVWVRDCETPPQEFWEVVADGGYYDNFGAAALIDVLDALAMSAGRSGEGLGDAVRLIVLQITSDPAAGMAEMLSRAAPNDNLSQIAVCSTVKETTKGSEQGRAESMSWWQRQFLGPLERESLAMEQRLRPADPIAPSGPVGTLMKARTRSGAIFSFELRRRVQRLNGEYYHFAMDRTVSAPLGWTLSPKSRRELDILLNSECNKAQFDAIVSALEGSRR